MSRDLAGMMETSSPSARDFMAAAWCISMIPQVCHHIALKRDNPPIRDIGDPSARCETKDIFNANLDHEALLCGYCRSGEIMSASALLAGNRDSNQADNVDTISGNVSGRGTHATPRGSQSLSEIKTTGDLRGTDRVLRCGIREPPFTRRI
jgi:hypothetical protein